MTPLQRVRLPRRAKVCFPPLRSKLLQLHAVIIFLSCLVCESGEPATVCFPRSNRSIKERFYYAPLPPRSKEAAGEEAAAPFWLRLGRSDELLLLFI